MSGDHPSLRSQNTLKNNLMRKSSLKCNSPDKKRSDLRVRININNNDTDEGSHPSFNSLPSEHSPANVAIKNSPKNQNNQPAAQLHRYSGKQNLEVFPARQPTLQVGRRLSEVKELQREDSLTSRNSKNSRNSH